MLAWASIFVLCMKLLHFSFAAAVGFSLSLQFWIYHLAIIWAVPAKLLVWKTTVNIALQASVCLCSDVTSKPQESWPRQVWFTVLLLAIYFSLILITRGQIHKTSYDSFATILWHFAHVRQSANSQNILWNFTTKILRSLFMCLMTFQIMRFQHHPTRKTSLYQFIRPLIQLYS